MRRYRTTILTLSVCIVAASTIAAAAATTIAIAAQTRGKRPLQASDIDAIATLLKLEDARSYDEPALSKLLASAHPEVRRRAAQSVGRIADKKGNGLLDIARKDKDVEVVATAAWSAGQLREAVAVPWLLELLTGTGSPLTVRREAAIALGKIQAPESRVGTLTVSVGDADCEGLGGGRRRSAAVVRPFPQRR